MYINTIQGPLAVKVGDYWLGVASGDRKCENLRMSSDEAIEDAKKMELTWPLVIRN